MAGFFVPEYYEQFRCKAGACRRSCCRGWNISLSEGEYERLLALQSPEELKTRIRGGLACLSGGKAAAFVRTQDGSCPLLREDGLCALQAEHGESALPSVCRDYPRAVRTGHAREIAFSASCEAVVEFLFASCRPLRFAQCETDPSSESDIARDAQALRLVGQMRSGCMRLLQDRSLPLEMRLAHLQAFLYEAHALESAGDARGLSAAAEALPGRSFSPMRAPESDWLHLAAPLALCGAFFPQSPSLREYWPPLTQALGLSQERSEWTQEHFSRAERRYALCRHRFAAAHPHWQEHWERLMANYAFYTQLPFSDRLGDLKDEALALCACYALTRFAAVCVIGGCSEPDALVDLIAAVMRLIEHSGFDRRCAQMLRQSRMDGSEYLRDMLLSV